MLGSEIARMLPQVTHVFHFHSLARGEGSGLWDIGENTLEHENNDSKIWALLTALPQTSSMTYRAAPPASVSHVAPGLELSSQPNVTQELDSG